MHEKISAKRIIIFVSIIVFFSMIFLFIVRPGIVGYSIYQDMKNSGGSMEDYKKGIEKLKEELIVSDTNLSTCIAFNQELMEGFSEAYKELAECGNELSTAKADVANLNQELIQKKEEIADLEEDYDLLTRNTANNLCCKARVDDPGIDSYIVENNKVRCGRGEMLRISC